MHIHAEKNHYVACSILAKKTKNILSVDQADNSEKINIHCQLKRQEWINQIPLYKTRKQHTHKDKDKVMIRSQPI